MRKNFSINMRNKYFLGVFCLFLLLVPIVCAETNKVSPYGVKYDSRIEGKFLYQDRVYVSVGLKDESAIYFNGTKEENRAMLKPHEEWFQNQINETLKNYSGDDFIFHTYLPRGFGMFVTEAGFEKFLSDERINSISLNDKGKVAFVSIKYLNPIFIFVIIGLILIFVCVILMIKKRRK
ncbi:MAG: hypothetical protein OQK82_01950 [Candidatus Pacearchaeota archaeon]|nr:hypothetical protein [Candidatus Pacearchaeota archaeon]